MKKFLRIAVYFFIFLGAWVPLAWLLANYLIVEKPLSKADAILILGGSATYVERSQEAAEIFKKRIAPKIFLSNDGLQGGWNQKEQRNPYFAERARWELIRQGVPEEAIEILPTVVGGTNDEANLFVKVSTERKLKSLLLVTSAYHTRRALRTFERKFAKETLRVEIGIESAPPGIQTPKPSSWWLSSIGWNTVAGEYVKTFYYWVFY
ncbi:MAG: YdcF family protein [Pyrinomonadaceae bacterium]